MSARPEHDEQHAYPSIMTAIAELDKLFQPAQGSPDSTKRARSSLSRKDASVSTPALMSVLPPSRKRQRISWLAEEQLKEVRSPKQVYRPLSQEDLLERIATFTLTVWDDRKPEGCSAVDFARRGWRCTGKKREEVSCDVCKANWQASVPGGSTTEDEALRQDVRTRHLKSCPWQSKGCPPELYRLHLSAPPQQLLREVVERAISFPSNFDFDVKHPLPSDDVAMLQNVLKSGRCREIIQSVRDQDDSDIKQSAALAGLFGWASTSQSSNTTSTAPTGSLSSSLLMQCKLCARRLAVKGGRSSPSGSPSVLQSRDDSGSSGIAASPNKLSTVDVFTSHRRFCPYVSPAQEDETGQLGYQALLERIKHAESHSHQGHVVFQPPSGDRSKSNLQQTREAVRYVKSLLHAGQTSKRKYGLV